jgi:hypothetical protein
MQTDIHTESQIHKHINNRLRGMQTDKHTESQIHQHINNRLRGMQTDKHTDTQTCGVLATNYAFCSHFP